MNSPQKSGLKWQMSESFLAQRDRWPVDISLYGFWSGVSQGLGSKQTANNAAVADANRDTAADDKIG